MNSYDIKLSNGVKTYLGKLVVADEALYFLCSSTGSAILEGVGIGVRGAVGVLMKALADKGDFGQIPSDITENDLKKAANEIPNSLIFEAQKIEKIQQNWALRMIKWNGQKIGVPSGFSKDLKKELGPWAKKRNITVKGF